MIGNAYFCQQTSNGYAASGTVAVNLKPDCGYREEARWSYNGPFLKAIAS